MKLGKLVQCSEGSQMLLTHDLAVFMWVSVSWRCSARDPHKNAAGYQTLSALIQIPICCSAANGLPCCSVFLLRATSSFIYLSN